MAKDQAETTGGAGDGLLLVVQEDTITRTWTFQYQGHTVELERGHGFVKIDGQIYTTPLIKGLDNVEDLQGEALEHISRLIARHREDQDLQPQHPPTPPLSVKVSPTPKSKPDEADEKQTADEEDEAGEELDVPPERQTLTTPEAAKYLRLSPKTLETKRSRGGGPPYIKLGRRVVYRRTDLDKWLESRVRHSTS